MPDWIVKYWVQWLFALIGGGVTAIGAAVIAHFKKRSTKAELSLLTKRVEAMEQQQTGVSKALRASMYDRLYYFHGKFMRQKWISVPDLENVTGIYEGYHGLGGNGVGTKLYEDLKKLPSFEPM